MSEYKRFSDKKGTVTGPWTIGRFWVGGSTHKDVVEKFYCVPGETKVACLKRRVYLGALKGMT